jgi:hypothetical protein
MLIEGVGDVLRKAVEDIKAELGVGLSMEGAMFGQHSQAISLSSAICHCGVLLDFGKLREEEYDALKKLADNHVLIEDVGDVFINAVEDIKAESGAGLSMEGAMFEQHSQASSVSSAISERAFLLVSSELIEEEYALKKTC